jgi:hypothetical protein
LTLIQPATVASVCVPGIKIPSTKGFELARELEAFSSKFLLVRPHFLSSTSLSPSSASSLFLLYAKERPFLLFVREKKRTCTTCVLYSASAERDRPGGFLLLGRWDFLLLYRFPLDATVSGCHLCTFLPFRDPSGRRMHFWDGWM